MQDLFVARVYQFMQMHERYMVNHLQNKLIIMCLYAFQVLGTDELNAYLNKYQLELDSQLDALVGR